MLVCVLQHHRLIVTGSSHSCCACKLVQIQELHTESCFVHRMLPVAIVQFQCILNRMLVGYMQVRSAESLKALGHRCFCRSELTVLEI